MTYDQTERLIRAFEQMARAQEQSLEISKAALAVQQQMAHSSAQLEKMLGDSNGHTTPVL